MENTPKKKRPIKTNNDPDLMESESEGFYPSLPLFLGWLCDVYAFFLAESEVVTSPAKNTGKRKRHDEKSRGVEDVKDTVVDPVAARHEARKLAKGKKSIVINVDTPPSIHPYQDMLCGKKTVGEWCSEHRARVGRKKCALISLWSVGSF